MTKILITGGAGYIGNILLRELLENQHNKITVIDNFSYSQHNNYKNKSRTFKLIYQLFYVV